MERTSALSTSSPLRSFCGSGRGVHSQRQVGGAAQGAGLVVQEQTVRKQAIWQRVLDCPVSDTDPLSQAAIPTQPPTRLHHVQQHVQQAAADAAVAHHHVAPQVQPQLVHSGLVLQQWDGVSRKWVQAAHTSRGMSAAGTTRERDARDQQLSQPPPPGLPPSLACCFT